MYLVESKMEGRQAGNGIWMYTFKVWPHVLWYIKVTVLEQHRMLGVS